MLNATAVSNLVVCSCGGVNTRGALWADRHISTTITPQEVVTGCPLCEHYGAKGEPKRNKLGGAEVSKK